MTITENELTKGQLRKLMVLRKSVGGDIGDSAFLQWLKLQDKTKSAAKPDPVAMKILDALSGFENDKTFRLGNYGYTIRRARGQGASGFKVSRNLK